MRAMMARPLLPVLLALALMTVPPALGQDQAAEPQEPDCTIKTLRNVTLEGCLTFPTGDPVDGRHPGQLEVEFSTDEPGVWNVTVQFDAGGSGDDVSTGAFNTTDPNATRTAQASFTVSDAAESPLFVEYEVIVQRLFPTPTNNQTGSDGNATSDGNQTADGNQTGPESFGADPSWRFYGSQRFQHLVNVPGKAPPTGVPIEWFVGAGVLVFILVAGTVVIVKRQRTPEHTVRSRALQQIEQERTGGKGNGGGGGTQATTTRPPEDAQRGQRAILEARRDDTERILELAETRKEKGEITEHQYKLIKERKRKELAEIEEEIRELDES